LHAWIGPIGAPRPSGRPHASPVVWPAAARTSTNSYGRNCGEPHRHCDRQSPTERVLPSTSFLSSFRRENRERPRNNVGHPRSLQLRHPYRVSGRHDYYSRETVNDLGELPNFDVFPQNPGAGFSREYVTVFIYSTELRAATRSHTRVTALV